MKFSIISIILHLILLFTPIVVIKNIEKKETTNNIIINLENSEFVSENTNNNLNSEFNSENQENIEKNSEIKTSKLNERNNYNLNNENKIIETKSNNKTINENVPKVNEKVVNNNASNSNKQENTHNESTKIGYNGSGNSSNSSNNNLGNSNGNSINNINNSNNSGNNTYLANKSNSNGSHGVGNVCRENIDFIVTYNPIVKSILATRMGLKKEIIINVKMNFNSDGSVRIVDVIGENGYKDEVRNIAKKIKVKIINKESLKCLITKPFRILPSK